MLQGHPNELHTCDRHLFLLRHEKDQNLSPQVLKASFCLPSSQKHSRQTGQCPHCTYINCPTFNNDQNCLSPAFVLTLEKSYYGNEMSRVHIEHDDFPIASCSEKSQLFQPKPKSKYRVCHVCKIHYKDYREHIKSKMHKKLIRRSPFNNHILELTERFSKKRSGSQQLRGGKKMSMIAKTTDYESDQLVIMNRVEKVQKKEEVLAFAPIFGNYNPHINWNMANYFRDGNYQHQQQLLAYQTAYYHHLYHNWMRNTTHSSFSNFIPDPIQPTPKVIKSLTFIIIDE